ncbi:MAG: hypothetical protein ACK2UJ_00090 [Candidatus Promineifilaceae bacterium]
MNNIDKNKEKAVLAHDLMILEEMAANMADYLDSDVIDWTIPRANMPGLTIGGYLMRQHRLGVLKARLNEDDQARLEAAVVEFNDALSERVVRFETRAHQELHTRIAEWIAVLPALSRHARTEANYYAGVVDIRVVISELINKLQSAPYRLESGVIDELNAIDLLLKERLEEQDFIWDPIWQVAYPKSDYWWLYGSPRIT